MHPGSAPPRSGRDDAMPNASGWTASDDCLCRANFPATDRVNRSAVEPDPFHWRRHLERVSLSCVMPPAQAPLSAPLEISFDYTRSLGPVLSQFMAGLTQR